MTYSSEEILKALKSARDAKGLSQRELSARAGLPQSHISKIEQGKADLRLSSLIELARSLDMELKLVPRQAVPAVDSLTRDVIARAQSRRDYFAQGPRSAPRPAYRLDDDDPEDPPWPERS